MRRLLVLLLVACLVTVVVAAAFAQERPGQGRQGGRGRMQPGTMPEMFTSVAFLEGKIYALKSNVLYKIDGDKLKVEKKKKLELPEEEGTAGRFRRARLNLRVEGKNLFLVGYNVIYKIDTDTLEISGTLKASDLTPPEEEKEEEEEGEKEGSGGGEF
jgi:hypothetical protein